MATPVTTLAKELGLSEKVVTFSIPSCMGRMFGPLLTDEEVRSIKDHLEGHKTHFRGRKPLNGNGRSDVVAWEDGSILPANYRVVVEDVPSAPADVSATPETPVSDSPVFADSEPLLAEVEVSEVARSIAAETVTEPVKTVATSAFSSPAPLAKMRDDKGRFIKG